MSWHLKTMLRCLLTVLTLAPVHVSGAAESHPNVVIVLADDMGYGDVGCYNSQSKCPTPHIDALAKAGMRFTDAHAAGAWCTPSRYGLLTGRYAFRTSLKWQTQPVIADEVLTIADVLGRAGYQTAMVGKWHLGFVGGKQLDFSAIRGGPCDRGFSSFFGLPASLDIPNYYWIVDRRVPHPPRVKIADSQSEDWSAVQGRFWRGGLRGEDFVMEDVLDRLASEAERQIDQLSAGNSPFLLYVPLTSPHTPWLPSRDYASANGAGLYSQFVAHTDAVVGRIAARLQRANCQQNTVLIFSSDNGPVWYETDTQRFQHDAMGGLRGMKGDVWEAGHRIPFIVCWPAETPPGTVRDQLISFVDVHATLAELAGVEKAASAVDSISFADLWRGKSQQAVRTELICFQEPIALRAGRWKLINHRGSAGFLSHDPRKPFLSNDELNPQLTAAKLPSGQLYDLSVDRSETNNLWQQRPQLVERLKSRLAVLQDGE